VEFLAGYRGKRSLDVLAAFLLLVILSPVLLAVAALVIVSMGQPVLFLQKRPGIGGRLFVLAKFRTMRPRRAGQLTHDGERVTVLGNVLRHLSLDELPELWNVLRGDMSLVGPRPLLVQYLERYTAEQARRHEVRPGITGWAQVNGRNALSWEEKFRLDVWYVDNCSFTLDMRILALTLWQVIARRGINQPGHATAEEFMGTQQSGVV
jgi:sugar transferase EpsL